MNENRSFVIEFIEQIRNNINLVIVNKLRSTTIKLKVKNIKHDSIELFNFLIEWTINKIKLRFVLQRFEKNITNFKNNFINFKSQLLNSNNFISLFESTILKTNRYRSKLSKEVKRRFVSFFFFYFNIKFVIIFVF